MLYNGKRDVMDGGEMWELNEMWHEIVRCVEC